MNVHQGGKQLGNAIAYEKTPNAYVKISLGIGNPGHHRGINQTLGIPWACVFIAVVLLWVKALDSHTSDSRTMEMTVPSSYQLEHVSYLLILVD